MSVERLSYEELKAENERLNAILKRNQENIKKRNRFIFGVTKRIGFTFLGQKLKSAILQILDDLNAQNLQKENVAELLTQIFIRFTRIGVFGIILSLIPTSIIILQTILLNQQTSYINNQTNLISEQNRRLSQQTYLQETEHRSSLMLLFSDIMNSIDTELKNDYNNDKIRNLSPLLVGRIISISQKLEPYKHLNMQTDKLSGYKSPERGLLLINLYEARLDTSTYSTIFEKADFSYADLASMNFTNAHFPKIKLANANLDRAKLINSNLIEASLDRAKLNDCTITNTNLNYAKMFKAKLQGVSLNNTKLYRTSFEASDLYAATFTNVNLEETNFSSARLSRPQFINCNFRNTNFNYTQFNAKSIKQVKAISFIKQNYTLEPHEVNPSLIKLKSR